MRYSATSRGFFPEEIDYPQLPDDLVAITAEYHAQLMAAQNAGAEIRPDANGVPQAVFPPPPTLAQVQAAYTDAIEAHVEATARARGYSSAVSCATYAASTIAAWQAEGAAFVAWRDDVWTAALAMLAAVQAGGAIPESPIAGLPEMEWPA